MVKKRASMHISSYLKNDHKANRKRKCFRPPYLQGTILGCLTPRNPLRKFASNVLGFILFDSIILILIVISSVMIVLQNPLSSLQDSMFLTVLDLIFTFIFLIELIVKLLVYGLVFNGKTSFLRNWWNMLDIVVVVSSMMTDLSSASSLGFLKALRIIRVLRPLRLINRNEGLKVAVKSLIKSVPKLLNITVVMLFTFFIFGVFATQYLKGTFSSCSNNNIASQFQNNTPTIWACLDLGGDWAAQDYSFDNIVRSTVTLFEVATTSNWFCVMWSATDAVGININPIRDYQFLWVLFFVLYLFISFLLILNIFVGVMVKQFDEERKRFTSNYLLSNIQTEWIKSQILFYQTKPISDVHHGKGKFRMRLTQLVDHPRFDIFIIIIIILNTIVLALQWFNEPTDIDNATTYINYGFSLIFIIECILKLIAYGKFYFYDGWNVFDFIVAVGSCIFIPLELGGGFSSGQSATALRTFRLGRVLKLVKKAKSLLVVFTTFIVTLPSLANVGALLLLFIYIYTVLGMNILSQIKLQSSLDVHQNFQTFGTAFFMMIKVSTGDNWNCYMHDAVRELSVVWQCNPNPTYESYVANGYQTDGCGTPWAYVFFISFMMLISFCYLNLFIAIVIEGFDEVRARADLKLSVLVYDQFREIWFRFDRHGTGFIEHEKLANLFVELAQEHSEMILNKSQIISSQHERLMLIGSLEIPSCGNRKYYYYYDVLYALTKYFYRVEHKAGQIQVNQENEVNQYGRQETFEDVIHMMNVKSRKKKIHLYEKIKRFWADHNKKMKHQMDYIANPHGEDIILDSRHVIFGPIITKHARCFLMRQREKRARRQEMRKSKHFQQEGEVEEEKSMPSIHQEQVDRRKRVKKAARVDDSSHITSSEQEVVGLSLKHNMMREG